MKTQEKNKKTHQISIAPMLDWTDRHFRYFLRQITKYAVFYTEMTAMPAILLGDREKLIGYNEVEHPLILQVGGSHPDMMAECAKYAYDYGYQGININAGCPSSRVQAGKFGAILMKTPELVAECVDRMVKKVPLPVSVKTRIALSDTQGDGFKELFHFASLMKEAGCHHLIVHARKAKLNWSPKENRAEKMALNYDVVYQLKKSFPDMIISINGNILSLESAREHLKCVDGAMIGRLAYGNPYALSGVDTLFYGATEQPLSRIEVLENMIPYLEKNEQYLSVICPHLMGLFHGQANAKIYKQILAARDIEKLKQFIKEFFTCEI